MTAENTLTTEEVKARWETYRLARAIYGFDSPEACAANEAWAEANDQLMKRVP